MAVDSNTVQNLTDDGHVITNKDVSDVAKAEQAETGKKEPVSGGLAATAQSLHDKQQNFLNKEAELEKKPESEITKEDAKELQSAESRLIGHRPPSGSVSAHFQSVADKNDSAHQREDPSMEGKKEDQPQAQQGDSAKKEDDASSKDSAAPQEVEITEVTSAKGDDVSEKKDVDDSKKKDVDDSEKKDVDNSEKKDVDNSEKKVVSEAA